MASESTLQSLFHVAKSSLYFKGLTDEEIQKACLNYSDRPDADLEIAMENIRAEDQKILAESEKKQDVFFQAKEKVGAMRQEEALHKQGSPSFSGD